MSAGQGLSKKPKKPQLNSKSVDDDLLRCAFYHQIRAVTAGETYQETMSRRKNKSKFWLRHYDESYPEIDEHKFEVQTVTYNCWSLSLFEQYLSSPETYGYDDCRVEVCVDEYVSVDEEINDFGLKLLFTEIKDVDTDKKFNPFY